MDFTHYYGKHKHRNETVAQNNVRQKIKELHIRIDAELERNLSDLARNLDQDKSKIARDILIDHFLEQNTRDWVEEMRSL